MPQAIADKLNSPPLLEIRDLTVTFAPAEAPPVYAVRGISYSLAQGEILGIVGESGSGKSAGVLAIPALLPPTARVSGSIRFHGAELTGGDPATGRYIREHLRGKKIGMIFQEPARSYDPLQRVGAAFFEALRASHPGITRSESDNRAVRLLGETGITDGQLRLANFPHQFSGGQLQRIGIALALAQDCELLIADEPTTALDATIQAQIIALIKDIRDKRGISVLFISHNIDAATAISDRIMVMYGGLVMETGAAGELLTAPRHPYTRALLRAAPQFGVSYRDQRLASIPGKVPDPRYPAEGCPFKPRCPEQDRCADCVGFIRPSRPGRAP
ncbi:MAG: ABC transporter ATP-binding protein [Spirochaetaceae bacterium]|jgi:oligopeptide/dipeptide ABC transporter ATP-binding protein|nr:ABC transporter ATP-binding protein [Spirochaetaceae bacterium]